jgi:solute carrier family 35 protein F5
MARPSRFAAGVICILCTVLLWALSSEIINSVLTPSALSWDLPYTITWLDTSAFAVYALALPFLWRRDPAAEPLLAAEAGLTLRDHARIGAVFAGLYVAANVLYNASLSLTSAASANVLAATSSSFTLLLAVALPAPGGPASLAGRARAHLEPRPVLGIGLTLVGSVGIALADAQGSGAPHPLLGDAVGLAAAVCYACYATFLERSMARPRLGCPEPTCRSHGSRPSRRRAPSMVTLFAFVGVFCLLVLWVPIPLLSALGIEPFSLPPAQLRPAIAVNALLGSVASDLIWSYGVVLAGPVAATVGLALSGPTSVLFDFLLRGAVPTSAYLLAAAAVVAGFVLVILAQNRAAAADD